jgi:hypothetical protein
MFGDYFYFNDALRWNLFFSQPNQAGLFIATLIPFFWFWGRLLRRKGIIFFLIALLGLISEFFLWFLLFKTYSRGALVSLVVTGTAFLLIHTFLHPKEKKFIDFLGYERVEKSYHFFKIIGIGFLLFSSGFFDRIEPAYIANDRSVLNRIEIWKGGAGLIANKPITGWGAERSGEMFSNWFQNPNAEYDLYSLVNSYLTFGAEHGLIALWGVIFIMMTFVLTGVHMGITRRNRGHFGWTEPALFSCSACIIIFALGNVFSTLYREVTLWIVPLCAGFFLFSAPLFAPKIRSKLPRLILYSMESSLVICLLLFGASKFITKDDFYQIEKHPHHIELTHPGKGKSAYVMPDPRVLGYAYGKQIRKLAPHYHHLTVEWINYTSHPTLPLEKTFDEILVFGSQQFQYAKDLVIPTTLIHPIGSPGLEDSFSIQKLILPEIDISGGSDQLWKEWASNVGVPVFYSKNVGTDIRLDWPKALSHSTIETTDLNIENTPLGTIKELK